MSRKTKHQPPKAAIAKDGLPTDLVVHPRFGRKIIPSGMTASADQIASEVPLTRLPVNHYWPETMVTADPSRQLTSPTPYFFYVDYLRDCVDCDRPFIFYARDQQFCFEELGLSVGSQAIRCTNCRSSARALKSRLLNSQETLGMFKDLSGPIHRRVLQDKALVTLAVDLVLLTHAGIYGDMEMLRRLRRALLGRQKAEPEVDMDDIIGDLSLLLGLVRTGAAA
jgi:Probable zinc-ribbon domain